MPQELHVLRCFSCETFQVHIVKKTNKWECKVCGAKQSVKRNYGKGSGKDCRMLVMKLNEMQSKNNSLGETQNEVYENVPVNDIKPQETQTTNVPSKWSKYLDVNESDEEDNLNLFVED